MIFDNHAGQGSKFCLSLTRRRTDDGEFLGTIGRVMVSSLLELIRDDVSGS